MPLRYCLSVLLLGARLASAGLLVNPAGGSSLGFTSLDDDTQVTRNLGGTFNLYGTNITSLNVALDGFLGTKNVDGLFSDRNLHDLAAMRDGSVIAPFYDHLAFGAGSSITDRMVANTYYAITYQSIYNFHDLSAGATSDFQAVLFMADTTIGSFQFHARDVAFSYGNLASTPDGTFTVGVADPNTRTGTPGSLDGPLSDFSSLPTGSQFFLYRPTGPGESDFKSSVQSTDAPEPATVLLAGLGIVALTWFRKRR